MDSDTSQLLYDKHTEFLIEERDRRMNNIKKLCTGKKIIFHPVDMNIFLNVVRNVSKKYNIQNLIPNERYENIFAFLEEVLLRFKKSGVSGEDLEWIVKTFDEINNGKKNE